MDKSAERIMILNKSYVEPNLIEQLCTPQIEKTRKPKYMPISQRTVFQRPKGTINEPDTFDVLRRYVLSI